MKMSLHARMMSYEQTSNSKLMIRTPTVVKVDGYNFGEATAHLDKPYDESVILAMSLAMQRTLGQFEQIKFAYTYSDKAFFLLIDYDGEETNTLANGQAQAVSSLITSVFSREFADALPATNEYDALVSKAGFCGLAFSMPREEVCNYFIYRQNSAEAKLIYSLGRMHVDEEIKGVRPQEMELLLKARDVSKHDYPDHFLMGEYANVYGKGGTASRFSSCRAEIDQFLSGHG